MLKTVALKPEHAKLSAYFNLDNGSGRIRGVNLQGNEAVRPIFDAWLRPFNYLGATTLTTLNTGGTDHMPFDAIGLPGFQFIQDPLNYESRVTIRTWTCTRKRYRTISSRRPRFSQASRITRRCATRCCRENRCRSRIRTRRTRNEPHGRDGWRCLPPCASAAPHAGRAITAAGRSRGGGDLQAAAAADLPHQDLRSPRASRIRRRRGGRSGAGA